MVKRYYAEHTDVDLLFASNRVAAWQVFDRESIEDGGRCCAICLCNTRRYAFAIRDALNAASETSKN